MGEYTDLIKVLLGETVKYVFLLLLCVLAIRLWLRLPKLSAGRRWNNVLLASSISGIAGIAGYFSIHHSLSLLDSYYAQRALDLRNWSSGLVLFQRSDQLWHNADAVGGEGVCLLLLGDNRDGVNLIQQARAMRHGRNTPFEDYYEGELYFFDNQPDKAVPLLEGASANPVYFWNVAKMLTIIALDRHQIETARRLMKPFLQVPVEKDEYDHAYIMISFDLLDGKTNEARMLLDEFPPGQVNSFWKSRFARFSTSIQN